MFTILSISDSDKHREKVVEEYTKRLGKSVKIENIKPSRKGNNEQMIQADTENIIAKLEKFSEYKKILLSKEGKLVTTMDLHTMLTDKNCVFIIG
jgi:23S rRNA pseudoU1915 N3-methylase RlmH